MPLEGIFIEPSSTPLPDLSLHISLPNNSEQEPNKPTNQDSHPYTGLSLTQSNLHAQEQPTHHHNHYHHHHQDPSDAFRPIKGIPVYHNRPLPFLPLDAMDPAKMRVYNSGLDHMQDFNSGRNLVPPSGYRIPCGGTTARFNGLFYHQQNQYGVGASDISHHYGMMRSSRFLHKLPPPKRNMRAPRMRWTSSLHARFVHAVELLGGHESNAHLYIYYSLF